MIPRKFSIIRPSQVCKRGPASDPLRGKKNNKKRKTRSTTQEAVSQEVERVKSDVEEMEESGVGNNEMRLHIDGQSQPILIKVIGGNEGNENTDGISISECRQEV